MISTSASCSRPESEVLGLDSGEIAPVQIILAAQLQLRRCRSGQSAGEIQARSNQTAQEVRRIVAARDALLKRAVEVIARLQRERLAD